MPAKKGGTDIFSIMMRVLKKKLFFGKRNDQKEGGESMCCHAKWCSALVVGLVLASQAFVPTCCGAERLTADQMASISGGTIIYFGHYCNIGGGCPSKCYAFGDYYKQAEKETVSVCLAADSCEKRCDSHGEIPPPNDLMICASWLEYACRTPWPVWGCYSYRKFIAYRYASGPCDGPDTSP